MAGQVPDGEEGKYGANEEATFLSRLRSGDASAFEALVVENQGPLYGLLLRLAGDPDEALDLVQETFLRAIRGNTHFGLL